MKKSLFIIAATALVVGCASNDTFKDVDTTEYAIGFGDSYIGNITKATVGTNYGEMKASNTSGTSSGTLCADGNAMQVWGWKHNSSGYTTVFDATVVKYLSSNNQANGTNWTYTYEGSTTPLKFWDRAADYIFYAVAPDDVFTMPAPASPNTLKDNPEDRKFRATSVPDVQVLKDMNGASQITISNEGTASESTTGTARDYLVAAKVPCNAGYSNQGNDPDDKNVNFTFSHILSKLNVNVKTTTTFNNEGSNYPQIKLTSLSISIKGVCSEFNQKVAGALNAALSDGDAWSNPSASATTKTCFAIGQTGNTAALLLNTTNKNIASYFVAPTSTGTTSPVLAEGEAEVKVTIGYDIYYDGESNPTSMESCLLADLDVTNLTKIQQNTINNLNITIDPKAIYFDVQSVSDWTSTSAEEITVPQNN